MQEDEATSGSRGGVQLPDRLEVARRFELLLGRFPRADGEPWRSVEIERATGGEVTSAYVSALRTGKFKRPGTAHLSRIAKVMGFPFEMWTVEPERWDDIPGGRPPAREIDALDPLDRRLLTTAYGLSDRQKDVLIRIAQELEVGSEIGAEVVGAA